jgi:hypothetical protein
MSVAKSASVAELPLTVSRYGDMIQVQGQEADMADYSYAVPERMILNRDPADSGVRASVWETAVLRIQRGGRVEVTSERHAGSVPRSHDEDAQVELIFEIVDAQNDRQKIDTDALRTDLSNGGSLAVLIDRIVAGHTVQLIKSNWTGVFTNDAAQALDELRLELEYNAREACRYIDMEWMDEDSGTSDQ